MVKTRSDKPRRASKEPTPGQCRRCDSLLRADSGVAAQLDIMNATTITLEVARGLVDLLGLHRGGSRLADDVALANATREDLLRFAIDQVTAHLLGFCSIRCWGDSRK